MRAYAPEPRSYELMTVLSPDVAEDEIPLVLDRIGAYVTAAGGTVREILRESPWGRRRLAYPIRHGGRDMRDGYYTVYHLDLAPGSVEDIERDLKLNDQVIRYLLVHHTPEAIDPKTVEDAEIAAEDAAAAAYAAAQAAAQAAAGEAPPTAEPPAAEPLVAPVAVADEPPLADEPTGDATTSAEPAAIPTAAESPAGETSSEMVDEAAGESAGPPVQPDEEA